MKHTHFFLFIFILILPLFSYTMQKNKSNKPIIILNVCYNSKINQTQKGRTVNNQQKNNRMVPLDPEGINIVDDPYVNKTYSRS